jgi:hypothetical protein
MVIEEPQINSADVAPVARVVRDDRVVLAV